MPATGTSSPSQIWSKASSDDVNILRGSSLIPNDIPVGGAIYDVESGKLQEVTRK